MIYPFKKRAHRASARPEDRQRVECEEASRAELAKPLKRYHIINELLGYTNHRRYLEIGVRNPSDNFDRIESRIKWSVDPGLETSENLATFKMTSDEFFISLANDKLEVGSKEFDVVFIDGLHLAEQVYRDIINALEVISPVGFIVLHDCNPPTQHHARELFHQHNPAGVRWNGTGWKAFQRFRTESSKRAFVVDTDWGVGVIVNHIEEPESMLRTNINPFYEYETFARHRNEILRLQRIDRASDLYSLCVESAYLGGSQ